jgi:NAD(P)-dependent dehydrogenase (short-subunit alcohol dehydrogenase family)
MSVVSTCDTRRGGEHLAERCIAVTGGGTGLGLVTATTLAENGCKVYITGRRLEPLQEAVEAYKVRKNGYTHKGEIIAVQADVSTKEGITSESACLQRDLKVEGRADPARVQGSHREG